jgi:hypothetical protein
MKLIIHELQSDALEQVVTPDKNTIVSAIRPRLYRHNFATGSLKVQIKDDTDTVIAESAAVNISDIGTAAFFHGYVRFYVDAYLKKNQTYTVCLVSADGYSFDESAYCGWVNGYDLGKYATATPPADAYAYPLDLEIWERKVK